MLPAFPKPSQVKKQRPAVKVMKDGREICQLNTRAGQDEYARRKEAMWERQGKLCCLCWKKLAKGLMTFEHDEGRGHGGGHRDDRIEVNGKPINGVAHPLCNVKKGSVRKSTLDEIAP